MENELCSDFAHTDSLYLGQLNFPLNVGALEIVHCEAGDEEISFLLFLVVVEFEDGAAEEDAFWM